MLSRNCLGESFKLPGLYAPVRIYTYIYIKAIHIHMYVCIYIYMRFHVHVYMHICIRLSASLQWLLLHAQLLDMMGGIAGLYSGKVRQITTLSSNRPLIIASQRIYGASNAQ